MPQKKPIATDALREAAAKLDNHHLEWIVDTALKRYRDKVNECSVDMMRITGRAEMEGWDTPDPTYVVTKTYRDRLQSVSDFREQYLRIVAFLKELRKMLGEASSRRFAEDVAYYFRSRGDG